MKRKSKVVRLYGHWRVLTGPVDQCASSSDWINLAEHAEEGVILRRRQAVDRAETAGQPKRVSGGGYRVVGDKLIVLEPDHASAPAA